MTDNTERDALAAIVKQVSIRWGGPSMREFENDPPTRKHLAQADAVLAWMRENGYEKREPVVVDDAKVWRNHPGLGGADGIGVRHPDGGGHQWYTVERAHQVVAELSAGLAALTPDGQEGR